MASDPRASPLGRLVEPMILTAALASAEAERPADRAQRAETLRRAGRRADAADALFCDGHRAEAARVLARAIEASLALADEALHAALLAQRGIRLATLRDDLARLEAAHARGAGFGTDGERAFRAALARLRRLERALADATTPPARLRRVRALRLALGLFALGLGALIASGALPELPRRRVAASGQAFYEALVPRDAIDGDLATEWRGRDMEAGWLDVRFAPRARLRAIRVVNGRGSDAAAQLYVHAYARGEEVARFAHQFARAGGEVVFSLDAEVDQIRVEVPTFYGRGPALAEIDWE
ncbi:MAG: hypothetical protein KF729_08650 [Sandaracinaceae bacterium]|nr:hypothetical protein [Sandaracinaceae bacterium]